MRKFVRELSESEKEPFIREHQHNYIADYFKRAASESLEKAYQENRNGWKNIKDQKPGHDYVIKNNILYDLGFKNQVKKKK